MRKPAIAPRVYARQTTRSRAEPQLSSDFPEALRAFIQDNVPNIDAAELVLLLARNAQRSWHVDELVAALHPTQVTPSALRKYLARFESLGLVEQTADNRLRYREPAGELGEAVEALAKAYNERPVTLVRAIYALRDARLRSLADAFRLKKD